MKEALNTSNAAKLLGKSAHWVYINAERLSIPRYRIGGRWVYLENELSDWFMQQKIDGETGLLPPKKSKSSSRMYVEF